MHFQNVLNANKKENYKLLLWQKKHGIYKRFPQKNVFKARVAFTMFWKCSPQLQLTCIITSLHNSDYTMGFRFYCYYLYSWMCTICCWFSEHFWALPGSQDDEGTLCVDSNTYNDGMNNNQQGNPQLNVDSKPWCIPHMNKVYTLAEVREGFGILKIDTGWDQTHNPETTRSLTVHYTNYKPHPYTELCSTYIREFWKISLKRENKTCFNRMLIQNNYLSWM